MYITGSIPRLILHLIKKYIYLSFSYREGMYFVILIRVYNFVLEDNCLCFFSTMGEIHRLVVNLSLKS